MQATINAELESDITAFLGDLSNTQRDMLSLLVEKRDLLVKYDGEGLSAIAEREQVLVARLQSCLQRRTELLTRAKEDGLPSASIRDLTGSLPGAGRNPLSRQVQQASSQARILQHNSITNWVLVQRTLIHLSQMLEIIATGGRSQPTYGKGEAAGSSGALVDQAA
jgi:flagellar biosynthesis/type III secretory pathway chaperone